MKAYTFMYIIPARYEMFVKLFHYLLYSLCDSKRGEYCLRLWLHGIKQSVNLNITFLFVQLCSDPKSCEALDPQRPCGGLAEVELLCSLIHQPLYLVKQVRHTSDTMSYTHSHWVLFLSLKDLFRATATNPTHVNVCKHLRLPLFSSRLLYYIMHPYLLWIT